MNDPPPVPGHARKVSAREGARYPGRARPGDRPLVTDVGLPVFRRPTDTNFGMLVRSITFQQLAGAAAQAIHGRLVLALGEDVTPERLLATPAEALREAGLSARKVESLQDLSAKVLDGTVALDARRLARESDEEITARLTTVRGIGKWSSEMFLIFQLRAPGRVAHRRPRRPQGLRPGLGHPHANHKQLDLLGEPYRPYRSVVAWYCWRAAQIYAGTARTAVTALTRQHPA